MPEKKQHVEIERKLRLRTELIKKAGELTGAYYVPFIGEADIATALYAEQDIYGADLDPDMVATALKKLPDAHIIKANCDTWPFKDVKKSFSLIDADAYGFPYDSFRTFFEGAKIGSPCVTIFTDGQRQAILRTGHYRTPDGKKHFAKKRTDRRPIYSSYFNKIIVPWFTEYIKPWTIVYITKYLRGPNQMYWGAVITREGNGKPNKCSNTNDIDNIEKTGVTVDITEKEAYDFYSNRIASKNSGIKAYKFDSIKKTKYLVNISNGHTRGRAAMLVGISRMTVVDHMRADKDFAEAVSEAESDAIAKVENALYEAATSGNTTAIQVFLYNRDPKRWSDKRNIQLAGEGGGPIRVEIDAKGKLVSILARLAARAGETEGSTKP